MSTSSVPHSVELDDDVAASTSVQRSKRHKKYATLDKCNSLANVNGNLTTLARSATTAVNFEWYKQFRRNARKQQMMKSKSIDAASTAAAGAKAATTTTGTPATLRRSSSTMQYDANSNAATTTNMKSVNRDGTIARNHFRGVPGDFLDKHTKHFLLSMTVSILHVLYDTWTNSPKLSNKKNIKKILTVITSRERERAKERKLRVE